ncbi:MAG: RDD family protein [Nocardioidaceae bacterium]|jgi:uncharacterized RDD family membrane protein YckC|nr:RDD family protein [Nocardioidaceae bacterium]MCO5323916.1 RDD family protein [Nocardioidaceae bacterium]
MVPSSIPGSFVRKVTGKATNEVLEQVDPNVILANVDIDALLERVDIDALLDRVDIDALMARVNVDELIERVDLDSILDRVDLEALVMRSGVPKIIEQSTTHFAGSALNALRRQFLNIDLVTGFVIDRLLRRRRVEWAFTPAALRPEQAHIYDRRLDLSARYAGAIPRLAAVIVDLWLISISSTLLLAGFDYLNARLFGWTFDFGQSGWWIVGLILVSAGYSYFGLAIAGRTPGKLLLGLRVTEQDGQDLRAWSAFVRTICWPLSLALAGLGMLLMVVQPQRRGLHDLLAHTAVIHDWTPHPVTVRAAMTEELMERSS